ncbi:MAG: hypothetical protein QM820_32535 [Minicystis sp.]
MKYMTNILHAVFIAAPLALVGASGCVATTEDPDDLTQAEHTGEASQAICTGTKLPKPGGGWVCCWEGTVVGPGGGLVCAPPPPGGTTPAPAGN